MDRLPIKPKFQLGLVCATPGALSVLTALEIATALLRHQRGDWGDLSKEDFEENELSLREGFRILWIITEADRTATTVLLPSEY